MFLWRMCELKLMGEDIITIGRHDQHHLIFVVVNMIVILMVRRRCQRTRPPSTTPPCPTALPLPLFNALPGQLLIRQANENVMAKQRTKQILQWGSNILTKTNKKV